MSRNVISEPVCGRSLLYDDRLYVVDTIEIIKLSKSLPAMLPQTSCVCECRQQQITNYIVDVSVNKI